jgi:hypothetical protein
MTSGNQTAQSDRSSSLKTATILALAGLVSGVVAALLPDSVAKALNPVSKLFLLNDSAVHPGLLYGAAVALVLGWLGERRIWLLGLVIVIVSAAWSAAVNTATTVYDIKDLRTLFDASVRPSSSSDPTDAVKLLTGFAAGIVGALTMTAGLAILIPPLRNVATLAATTSIGGVAGLLIFPFLSGWNQTGSLILLFAVWQAGVGACIGLRLAQLRPGASHWPDGLNESAEA